MTFEFSIYWLNKKLNGTREIFLFFLAQLGKGKHERFADFAEKDALGERRVVVGIREVSHQSSSAAFMTWR